MEETRPSNGEYCSSESDPKANSILRYKAPGLRVDVIVSTAEIFAPTHPGRGRGIPLMK